MDPHEDLVTVQQKSIRDHQALVEKLKSGAKDAVEKLDPDEQKVADAKAAVEKAQAAMIKVQQDIDTAKGKKAEADAKKAEADAAKAATGEVEAADEDEKPKMPSRR